MMDNKVIITGATSFIGIALIKELLKNNYDIIAIVRPNSYRKKSLEQFKQIRVFEKELSRLSSECPREWLGSKYFFHLGWSSDFDCPRFNQIGQDLNVEYTKEAIRLAVQCGCEVFVGTGSQAECGKVQGKISERTLDNPITAYAVAKCKAYKEGLLLSEAYGIRFCWPRILSAYGPYDKNSTLIMSCIDACNKKRIIELTPCEQIWDYIFVEDVARALLMIAKSGRGGVKYSVASGKGKPLVEYIKVISDIMNYPQFLNGISCKKYVDSQPMYLVGDIETLIVDTAFEPLIDFTEGINKTIEAIYRNK